MSINERAEIIANRGIDALEFGNYAEAIRLAHEARGLFEQLTDSAAKRHGVGVTYQIEGNALLHLGSTEQALQQLSFTEKLLSQDPENVSYLASFLHDLAIELSNLNADLLAITYAERAVTALRKADRDRDASDTAEFLELLRLGHEARREHGPGPTRDSFLAVLRGDVASSERGSNAEVSRAHRLVGELAEYWEQADLPEIFDLMKITVGAARSGTPDEYIQSLSPMIMIALSANDATIETIIVPEWISAEVDKCAAALARIASPGQQAELHLIQGSVELISNRLDLALAHSLEARCLYDSMLINTRTSSIRETISEFGHASTALGLKVATSTGNAALALELLEGTRLQVLPDVGTSPSQSLGDTDSVVAAFASTGARAVAALRPISVDGRSYVRAFLEAGSPQPIELERVVTQIAGPQAWLWSGWAMQDSYYWALLNESGPVSCGVIDISDGTELRRLLFEAVDYGMPIQSLDIVRTIQGPLTSSYLAEERLSVALGTQLIPADLRAALLERARQPGSPRPLPLVVSGNMMSTIPVALLGIEPAQPDRYAARLIEAAVVHTGCPAVLIDHVSTHESYFAMRYPISLAVVDPTSNLHNAGRPPEKSKTVLARDGATRPRLQRELKDVGKSHPSVFYYSGHASDGSSGSDIHSGLESADGTLQADEIFAAAGTGGPSYPFPARAVLSACGSAGSGGGGSGEWLGLAAAVLWAGAREVVATAWPIWDLPFTRDFDLKLATALRSPESAASSLRRLQLECLAQWRRSTHNLTTERGLPQHLRSHAFPLVWAAYQVVGVR